MSKKYVCCYRYLARSKCILRFNRFSRAAASMSLAACSLTCPLCLRSWELAILAISIVTEFTPRSRWRSAYLTYQGALNGLFNISFWKRWMQAILLWLEQPHSWVPQAQTGFRTLLYIKSLFWIHKTDLLPTRWYILANCISTSPLFSCLSSAA